MNVGPAGFLMANRAERALSGQARQLLEAQAFSLRTGKTGMSLFPFDALRFDFPEARRLFAEQIDERITRARNRLPLDVGSPLAPHALVVRAAVRAPNVDAHQLRRDAEN